MNSEITIKTALFGKLCKAVLTATLAACGILLLPYAIKLLTCAHSVHALYIIATGIAAIAAVAYMLAELIYYALSKTVFYAANFVRAVSGEFAKRNRAWQPE